MSPSFIVKRIKKENGLPLYKVLPFIVDILSSCFSVPALKFAGYPETTEISLTEEGFIEYLSLLKSNPDKSFLLLDCDQNPQLVLGIGVNGIEIQGEDFIQIESIEFPVGLQQIQRVSSLENMLESVGKICGFFDSYYGYAWDEELATLFQRGSRMKNQYSPENRIGEEKLYLGNSLDILPSLLLSHEFDIFKVPNGIWWINYFSKLQVETLGRKRIEHADWAGISDLNNGAIICILTEEQTKVSNPEHLLKLQQVTNHLDLQSVQIRFKK
jgi:hypothetical protein